VVRLLVVGLETFRAEDEQVLTAGLSGSRFVTVDDTGARHKNKSGFTTQIGSDRFTVFRTGPSKSRLAFLRNLLGGAARYVVNEQALVYMRANSLPQAALDKLGKLANGAARVFSSHDDWMRGLNEMGLTGLVVTPDPVRVASEGALWGAICEEGRLGNLVIVSDGAGQFRIGVHAQCRVSGDVTVPTPHRPERADFLHSVLHGRALLVAAYGWKILTDGRGWRFRISFRRVHRTTLWRSLRESHFCHILTA